MTSLNASDNGISVWERCVYYSYCKLGYDSKYIAKVSMHRSNKFWRVWTRRTMEFPLESDVFTTETVNSIRHGKVNFKIYFFLHLLAIWKKFDVFLLFHKLRSLKDVDFSNLMRRPLWTGLRHKRQGKGKTFKGG